MIKITRKMPGRYDREYREKNGSHGSFESEVRDVGMEPSWDTKELRPADGSLVRVRKMWANSVPYQIAVTTVPRDMVALSNWQVEGRPGGLLSLLNPHDQPATMTETIRFREATGPELTFLSPNSAHLTIAEITHETFVQDGGLLMETTVCILPADGRWELQYDSWPPS